MDSAGYSAEEVLSAVCLRVGMAGGGYLVVVPPLQWQAAPAPAAPARSLEKVARTLLAPLEPVITSCQGSHTCYLTK